MTTKIEDINFKSRFCSIGWKCTKWVVFGLILFVTFVGILIFIGSRDTSDYESRGFSESIPSVPDEENGFSIISYTQDENSKFSISEEQRNVLNDHIMGDTWDQEFVDGILSQNTDFVRDVEIVVSYPKFQLPPPKNNMELPDYIPLLSLFRLVVLSAMQEERISNFDAAISYLDAALTFSQKLKTEENSFLISAMLGLRLQHEAVRRIHFLSNNLDLSLDQLARLQMMLVTLPAYEDDLFEKVFDGEFSFAWIYQNDFFSRSLGQRWSDYKNNEDWASGGGWTIPEEHQTFSREVFRFGNIFFPRFYMHRNRSLENLTSYFGKIKLKASEYCTYPQIINEEYDWVKKISWRDVFTPNSNGVRDADEIYSFDEYFTRRCLAFAYTEAVVTAIAIIRYRTETGAYPDSLEQLLPDYIETLPIDPFTGGVLNYSRENMWLYSFGVNHKDNAGDIKSMYYYRCAWDAQCSANPTFPVFAEFLGNESD